MSYRIEYQWACWRLPATPERGSIPRFVVAIEGGDNNLRDAVTGKRARDWDVCMLGSAAQVLKRAVYFAGACEGGSLKPGSRDSSPEAYIRRIRRLIEADDALPAHGNWYPNVRVPEAHPLAAHAQQLGLSTAREQRYGEWLVQVTLGPANRDLVFDFADRYPDLQAWQLADVSGLPRS
ncbi:MULTISPECIES: hypothetical protein [Piscinibacter]|uniref:hypothetical protein n=1 Tax=Piscinibacter TaxID=1114981 RepID=UPI000FDE444D|nr:hypothetical protein [Piscinibacter defluvii]